MIQSSVSSLIKSGVQPCVTQPMQGNGQSGNITTIVSPAPDPATESDLIVAGELTGWPANGGYVRVDQLTRDLVYQIPTPVDPISASNGTLHAISHPDPTGATGQVLEFAEEGGTISHRALIVNVPASSRGRLLCRAFWVDPSVHQYSFCRINTFNGMSIADLFFDNATGEVFSGTGNPADLVTNIRVTVSHVINGWHYIHIAVNLDGTDPGPVRFERFTTIGNSGFSDWWRAPVPERERYWRQCLVEDVAINPYLIDEVTVIGAGAQIVGTPIRQETIADVGDVVTIYMAHIEQNTLVSPGAGLFSIGNDAQTGARIQVVNDGGTYKAIRHNGASASESLMPVGALPGDYVETLVHLLPNGSVQISQRINGIETTASQGAAMSAVTPADQLYINGLGTVADTQGTQGFHQFKVSDTNEPFASFV